jgi:hypothetical protein
VYLLVIASESLCRKYRTFVRWRRFDYAQPYILPLRQFWGVSEAVGESDFGVIMPVGPFVRMDQRYAHHTDFCEVIYLVLMLKPIKTRF